jgi:selenocysteine-specific elongation factor
VLIRVGDALYRGSQIQSIHGKVETFINVHHRMTMAEFRDLLGTSRKYAVPLLEWFDSRAITVRSGDYRMLRSKKAV